MGAISGIYNFGRGQPADAEVLGRMCAAQRHRGPHHVQFHLEGPLGLAGQRLTFPSPLRACSPLANEQGTVWLAFSGVLGNRAELRAELTGRGALVDSGTNAELVLRCYEIHGKACVNHFLGPFALAVWDRRAGELFLARDHLGLAPLHYSVVDGQCIFASEAKGVLEHPAVPRDADEQAVVESLVCGTLFQDRTLFAAVRSLEPGTTLTVSAAGIRKETYWRLPGSVLPEADAPESACADRLRGLLEDAVRRALPADPDGWGIMLSGGVDSTTLTALARKLARQPIRTFTIDFPNAWRGEDTDAAYAALVARRLETEHRVFLTDPGEYFDALGKLVWHLERPFNKAVTSSYLLYTKLAPFSRTVLNGEGMDELLAGYVGARGLEILDEVSAGGAIRCLPWAPYHELARRLFAADFRQRVNPDALFEQRLAEALGQAPATDSLNRALYLYTRYFLLDLVELHDRSSFAAGVETRFPFLDRRLVEFLVPLPARLKYAEGQTKYLLRKVIADLVPPEVLQRRKTHLPVPRDPASMAAHARLARDLLLSPETRTARYFDRSGLAALVEREVPFADCDALTFWQVTMNLITLELLYRAYRL